MPELITRSLDFGITCIDALYVKPGLACFYLMEEGGEYAVLETGTSHSVPLLAQLLEQQGIEAEQVRYIIPTHVHLDHAGGAGAMMALFPRAELLIHPRGARHMIDPTKLVQASRGVYGDEIFEHLYGEVLPVDAARVCTVEDGERVELAGRPLEFRHTRGHAEHHICIWDSTSRGWFSGDMFGVSYPWCRFEDAAYVVPSTTPSQFDPQAFLSSLDLLMEYSPQRIYLTHYGMLPYTGASEQLLRRQVEQYCVIAQECAEDPPRLQARLGDYAVALLQEVSGEGDEAAWREALAFDMQLNAQGLQVWLARGDR